MRRLFNKQVLSIILSILILVVLFFKINLHDVYRSLINANLIWLLAGVALTVFYAVFGAMRWLYALKAVNLKIPYFRCFGSVMLAFAINVLTPAKAGDLVKGFAIRDLVSIKRSTSVVIAERLGDLLVLGLLALIGSIVLHNKIIMLVIFVFLLLWFFGVFISTYLSNKLNSFGKIGKIIAIVSDGAVIWKTATLAMCKSIFWSWSCWMIACLQVWIFFNALGADVSFWVVLSLFPVAVFITLIPITFAGLGVRETAFAYLFFPYAAVHFSVSVSLSYFVCSYGLTALMGIIYLTFVSRGIPILEAGAE